MNYLAHLLLAGNADEHVVGGLLADFVRPAEISAYSPGVQAGIRLHQRIDAFSDGHGAFARSRRRLRPPYRRWAPVLVDIFYDHFLAADWNRHSPGEDLDAFRGRVYGVLARSERIFPERLRRMLPRMIGEDWLGSYRDAEGVERTLKRLSRRPKRPNPLADAACVLRENYDGLADDFAEFFPELTEFSRNGRSGGYVVGQPKAGNPKNGGG